MRIRKRRTTKVPFPLKKIGAPKLLSMRIRKRTTNLPRSLKKIGAPFPP